MTKNHNRFVCQSKTVKRFAVLLCCCLCFYISISNAQQQVMKVITSPAKDVFTLVSPTQMATIITDTADAQVTGIAALALSNDIALITGKKLNITHNIKANTIPIIIGTLGRSKWVDELAKSGKIDVSAVKSKWETFCLAVIESPLNPKQKALVIFGSDPRGTAFGVFELSKMLGVSPYVWWADVTPEHRDNLYISAGLRLVGPPSVKYRGFFINDEDWGIRPWAAKNIDKDLKDIGPKTYQRVFELMLRLKANYLWPAMHPGTKAFWYYKENPELARAYDIVMGSSHHEPMLRDTEWEWNLDYKEEYGVDHGAWRYDTNHDEIYRFFDDRVKQSVNNDAIYTVGMRATKDGPMPGPPAIKDKVKLLAKIINDQREILTKRLGKPADQIPQVFCPYKEVLPIYQAGLQVPDDVTMLWVDDNHGYIRRLSNPGEQKRAGGSGVYYHFSYWGAPQDYLWLSSVSPALTAFEMQKAYALNARQMWVFNVGDIKPAELELQFAMDMAWDINAWTPENANSYPLYWAGQTFGKQYAEEIAAIKATYYILAASGKPEHLNFIDFTDKEIFERLTAYKQLAAKAMLLESKIPVRLKDAYFELVNYPVQAAMAMNEKVLYAKESLKIAGSDKAKALAYSEKAKAAYALIGQLTEKYNKNIAGGKWDGMMDDHPRNREVFKMPKVAGDEISATSENPVKPDSTSINELTADKYTNLSRGKNLQVVKGLGVGGNGLTVWPLNKTTYEESNITQAPFADYKVMLKKGKNNVEIKCLPNFPLYPGMKLRYAISIDTGKPVFKEIAAPVDSKLWAKNVLRGYASGNLEFESSSDREASIRIYFTDPGLVVNQISVEHFD